MTQNLNNQNPNRNDYAKRQTNYFDGEPSRSNTKQKILTENPLDLHNSSSQSGTVLASPKTSLFDGEVGIATQTAEESVMGNKSRSGEAGLLREASTSPTQHQYPNHPRNQQLDLAQPRFPPQPQSVTYHKGQSAPIPQPNHRQTVKSDYNIDASNVDLNTIANGVKASSTDSVFTTTQLSAVPKDTKTIDTPLGIFILSGYYLIIFGISFLDSSVISWVYAGIMLLNLGLVLSLFFRVNVLRRLTIAVSIITLTISLVSMFMVTNLMKNVKNLRKNYQDTISRVDAETSSDTMQLQLETINQKITEAETQTGRVNGLTYAKLSLILLGNVGAVAYLTRPRVKLAFVKQEE